MIAKAEVKYIQSLAHKKFRETERRYVVEGLKVVEELIAENPSSIKKLYAVDQWAGQHASSLPKQIKVHVVEQFELEKISGLKTPDGLLALVEMPILELSNFVPKGITVALDQIQDPGNLGTIIRSCDWFGIENLVCSLDTVDAFNPKVVQAAKGSLPRVNIFYVDLKAFFTGHHHLPVYAAVLDGQSVHTVDFSLPCMLLMGNESKGISAEIRSFATHEITIPKKGRAESLNAGVATSIILSSMTR